MAEVEDMETLDEAGSDLRLSLLDQGLSLPAKACVSIGGVLLRAPLHDVYRVLLYRPGFFGYRFLTWAASVLRGRSDWSPGERELFGAFTSRLNLCPY